MIQSYKKFWSNIFNVSGTSNRPDFWWPVIINSILGAIFSAIFQPKNPAVYDTGSALSVLAHVGISGVGFLIAVIVWIANLTVSIRRLHDTDRSGWWLLIQIIPVIGQIWLLIYFILPTKRNRWQDNG